MSGINWSILSNALTSNPGEAFTRGLETGVTRSALGALTQNPSDTRAMSALAAFNPQAAMQMQERQRQQVAFEREAEQRRVNIQAGQRAATGDTAGARNLMLSAGNFEGATQVGQMESAAAKARREQLESFSGELTYLETLGSDAERAAYVRQRAPQLAQAFNIPPDHLASFDGSLSTVRGLAAQTRTAAQQLEAQFGGQFTINTTRFDRNAQPIVSMPDYKPVEGVGLVEVPVQTPVYPSRPGQGAPAAPAPQAGAPVTVSTPEEARSLPPGTEFRTPDGRTLRVPGGPASSAPGGFPDTGSTYTDPTALRVWNGGR